MTTATITAAIDSMMSASAKTDNYGGVSNITVSNVWSGGDKLEQMRAIGKFDLSGIPVGATIDSAKLVQNIYQVDTGNRAATLYRIVRSGWVENAVTWNQWTWSTNWTTGGADDDPTDHVATDKVAFTFPASTGEFDITGMKTLVDDAIANRSNELHVLIHFDGELEASGNDRYQWRSSEYATVAERWRLVVEYTAVADRRRAMGWSV